MSDLEKLIRSIVRDELAKAKPSNEDTPAGDYLSVREAADLARCSVYTIRRWVRAGELSKKMAGSRLLVRRAELEKFLACDVVSIDSKLSIEERVRRRFG